MTIKFIQDNFGIICLIFFLILSEILAFKPAWGSSGVVKLILTLLKGEARKAEPDVVKMLESETPAPANQPPAGTSAR